MNYGGEKGLEDFLKVIKKITFKSVIHRVSKGQLCA